MRKRTKWILTTLLSVFALGFILPWCAGNTRTGSRWYAHKWRKQLHGCNSPSDANEMFTCYTIGKEPIPESRTDYIPDVKQYVEDRPLALIQAFDDGNWIICVHSPTHGPRSGPGAGTVVVKDSKGKMTAYLGHICDRIWISGENLDDFYSSLERQYRFKKIIKYN